MKTNWKLFGLEMLFFVLPLLIIFMTFNREPNQNSEFIRLIIWLFYYLIFIFLTKLLSKNHSKIKQFYDGINNSSLKNKDSKMLPVYVLTFSLSVVVVMVLSFILGLYLPNFYNTYGMLVPLLAVIIVLSFLQCSDFKNVK
ncbi:hypothetical protein [Apilactobacillus micheneri]|uniref:hypothetical protein n=1 Tax=Apilactobacillus micheneri TaxID=1899430 RepID=UPI00112C0523|nr:hypothetical protein [Apilactobacillus micheneri]TPR38879.1 hypothetical protein DY119_04220 [Apilactobacillus micheneri]